LTTISDKILLEFEVSNFYDDLLYTTRTSVITVSTVTWYNSSERTMPIERALNV